MNYQRIYEQLTAKDMIADYTEKHHIIPKCMGGSNDPSNLVRLTPEAHYVAHQLLVKIYPNKSQLIHAAHMMTVDSNGYRVNNKIYGWLRCKLKNILKTKTSPMKGKHFSDDHRAKISTALKGKIVSDETRAKMSAAKQNMSDETKAKMSAAKQNISDETRTKMSAAKKGRSAHNKGKKHSAESIAKMSAAKQNISDETRAKMSAAKKGRSAHNKGKKHSAETKANAAKRRTTV